MARLLIGNDFDEDLRDDRGSLAWWVQRLVWFARDNDVLVLPEAPEDEYLEYVTKLTGVCPERLTVVVPPQRGTGNHMLTGGTITDPAFLEMLKNALAGRRIDEVIPLWPDASVAALAEWLGAAPALAGHGFISQGGGAIVASKAIFRAVSAGVRAPLPAGAVCLNVLAAENAITRLIERGQIAMVKLEYGTGGAGNEVVSPIEGVRPVGARRTVVVTNRVAVRTYLQQNWDRLTAGGKHRVIVERYMRDSRAYFVEFLIHDDAIELDGIGEVISSPQEIADVMPPEISPELEKELVDGGHLLCEALRAMGYRGWSVTDAIITPNRKVMFSEWNGRVTACTHVFRIVRDVVVDPGCAKDRVLLERMWPRGWTAPSFHAMLDTISSAGLAYNKETRTGVLIISGHDPQNLGATYCVVASDIDSAWEIDDDLGGLFSAS